MRFSVLKLLLLLMIMLSFSKRGNAQCQGIDLVSDLNKVCQPAAYKWVVQNAPLGSTFLWDFGNGDQKGQDTFYAFIENAGQVNVNVKISFPNGGFCELVKNNFVEVLALPVPKIYTSTKTMCHGPDTLTLFDITPNTLKRTWLMEGQYLFNTTSAYKHRFTTSGIKKLTMVVENINGCIAIKDFDSIVTIYPKPSIDFKADMVTGCTNKYVNYVPIISQVDPNYASNWTFTGGQPYQQLKNNPDPIYYNNSGNFSTTLQINTQNGCQYTVSKSNYLSFGSPANLSIKFSDTAICAGKTLTIENLDKTLSGTFGWVVNGSSNYSEPDKYTCKVNYNTIGKYDVTVTYNHNGCIKTQTFNQIIRVKGIQVDFSSNDNFHCKFPQTVHLKNNTKTFESGTMFYQWFVYEGSTLVHYSNHVNDSFLANKNGNFTVELMGLHSNGCEDKMEKVNFISNHKIKPDFDAAYTFGCKNQTINFIQKTPTASYSGANTYKWTFFDKNGSSVINTSNVANPNFSYGDTGYYHVKLVAQNNAGCKDSITKFKFIRIVQPKINFDIITSTLCKEDVLMAKGNSKPVNGAYKYSWYLKNRTTGMETIFVGNDLNVVLGSSGSYDLKFMHEINGGCKDSIIQNNLINSNGISAKIVLDKNTGCSPLRIQPKVSINENYHFGNASNRVRYKWTVNPSQQVSINNDTSSVPEITFGLMGEYTVQLEIENSVGCKQICVSNTIYVGVKANFTLSDNLVCNAQKVTLENTSPLRPTAIKWLIDDGTFTTQALTDTILSLQFKSSGLHKIGLVVSKENLCFDTLYKTVNALEVKAKMVAIQSNLKCAPVYAKFKSHSLNADYVTWDFGDGNKVTTSDSTIANIYYKNSGASDGYDLKLIAYNKEGCSDTLFKPKYMKVLGPVPSFKVSHTEACHQVNTIFTNESKDVAKYLFNYGDGSSMDTIMRPHLYKLSNDTVSEVFVPTIYATDEVGCLAILESLDTIFVHALPKAKFSLNDDKTCENLTIHFKNTSNNTVESHFYLKDLNKPIPLLNQDSIQLLKGNYQIMQIVKNKENCVDTLIKTIQVNSNPVASIKLYDTVCFNKVLNFVNLSSGENPINTYDWKIEQNNQVQNFSNREINHAFTQIGPAHIQLTVTDTNQCKGIIHLNLQIPDTSLNIQGKLKYVSVNPDGSFQLVSAYTDYSHFLFGEYINSKNNSVISNNYTKNESTINYSNIGIDTMGCFDYRITDVCGYKSTLNNRHCIIYLKVNSQSAFTNTLTWTKYIGWSSVNNYHIYRKKASDFTFTLLKTVSANINQWIDTGLCNTDYTYYVEAQYQSLTSQSNLATNAPIFIYPEVFKDIKNVTVNNNQTITISWLPSKNPLFKSFTLSKFNEDFNKVFEWELTDSVFTDMNVNPGLQAYNYSISEVDRCQNKSQPKYSGKSIQMATGSNNYITSLRWNTYLHYKSGIKKYEVELEERGQFKSIYTGSPSDSIFTHSQLTESIHGSYCYRVKGISGNGLDSSYSNISCVISPSTLFFANAFTPNGDGINEKIGAKSLFVYSQDLNIGRGFNLQIFNHWGEKVFESNDIDEEWDGKYKGELVPIGNYMYQLKASGADYRNYTLNGTIAIIR